MERYSNFGIELPPVDATHSATEEWFDTMEDRSKEAAVFSTCFNMAEIDKSWKSAKERGWLTSEEAGTKFWELILMDKLMALPLSILF